MRHTRKLGLSILLACTILSCNVFSLTPRPAAPIPTVATSLPTATAVPTITKRPTVSPTPELSADEWFSRQNPVFGLAWSGDGQTLVAVAASGVYMFDVELGAIVHSLEGGEFLSPLAVDPQGQRLFVGNRVWDVNSGQLLYELPRGSSFAAAFSPTGKTLAISDDSRVDLWDATSGKLKKSLSADFGDAQWGLAYSPTGRLLYAVSADRRVKQIDVVSGQFSELFSLPEGICCASFSPDIQYMIVNRPSHGLGSKQLWSVKYGELMKDLGQCDADVYFSAFSRNTRYFTIGPCGPDAQLWDTLTQKFVHNFPSRLAAVFYAEWRSAVFSPDGTKVAFGSDIGQVLIWDVNSYQLLNRLSIPLPSPLPAK